MALAFQKRLAPGIAGPAENSGESDRSLEVAVVFTSVDATLTALRKARALAGRLHARINLIVPQVVPYPLPLASPPVLLDFNEKRLRVIADESPVETTVRLYLCRDRWVALTLALKPRSLVVLGGARRWWPAPEMRLARRLQRAGHDVVFTGKE